MYTGLCNLVVYNNKPITSTRLVSDSWGGGDCDKYSPSPIGTPSHYNITIAEEHIYSTHSATAVTEIGVVLT